MENKSLIRISDKFKGNYFGCGNLILFGEFRGIINIDSIKIEKEGKFVGSITAKEIIIEGTVKADIFVDKIHILTTGKVEGELMYRFLRIDEGGFLNSSKVVKMSDQRNINKAVSQQ